jgi:hypothetical protein
VQDSISFFVYKKREERGEYEQERIIRTGKAE